MSNEFKQNIPSWEDIPLWIEGVHEMGEDGFADVVIRRKDDKELVFMFDNSSGGLRYQTLYYGFRERKGEVQEKKCVYGANHFVEIISKFLKNEDP